MANTNKTICGINFSAKTNLGPIVYDVKAIYDSRLGESLIILVEHKEYCRAYFYADAGDNTTTVFSEEKDIESAIYGVLEKLKTFQYKISAAIDAIPEITKNNLDIKYILEWNIIHQFQKK